MEPLGYYKWHWQAWRANRRVQRMSCLQKGIYRELLDECWADGSIPDAIPALADIAGCTEQELTDAWQLLSTCFYEVAPGRLTNRKLEEQRTETDTLRATRARAGEAGGKQKLANAKQVSSTCHIEEREEREEREEKSKEEESNTLAPTSFHESKPVGTIPCSGKEKVFPFTEVDVGEWQGSFPGIDVIQQLRQCRQWNIDNPTKRKTAKGMRRFINSWLSRAQDASGGRNGTVQQPTKQQGIKQRNIAAFQQTHPFFERVTADGSFDGMDDRLLPEPGSGRRHSEVLDGRLD